MDKMTVRISDKEALDLIEELMKNETSSENVMKEVLIAKMRLLVDIRQFLRKIYKSMSKKSKVYKRPTGNSKDIIVGKE